jgi:hypothetical protein
VVEVPTPGSFEEVMMNWNTTAAVNPSPANGMMNSTPSETANDSERHDNNNNSTESALGKEPYHDHANPRITPEDCVISMPDPWATPLGDIEYGTDRLLQFANSNSVNVNSTSGYCNTQEPTPPGSCDIQVSDKLQSEHNCIQICTRLISSFENYISTELRAFDVILFVCKRALEEINHLIYQQPASLSFRCRSLLAVAMYQIIILLESDRLNIGLNEDSDMSERSSRSVLQSSQSTFGFGLFEEDLEEQRSYQSQMMLRELGRYSEVLGKISRMPSPGGCQPEFKELEDRTRRLYQLAKGGKYSWPSR